MHLSREHFVPSIVSCIYPVTGTCLLFGRNASGTIASVVSSSSRCNSSVAGIEVVINKPVGISGSHCTSYQEQTCTPCIPYWFRLS